ncbi:stage III sporulation protein AF [Bacillus benzoevorans]|uniref:Stage III sporulation protein AF n=1 Tax=Bacillus benzoevorans TaxID=1456 RepID=A0A7X0HQE3_9BACI|nr:stage III sporulation protein AF [Bacillus benzoevorans]MBB6444879.1 stage III sporulation protein AF [Bacillus benzoevorans]
MELIKEWVTNIILFVLFATVLDMILPNSKFQKYTKMVVGLLLISIILTPVFKLFTYDLDEALLSVPAIGEGQENAIKNLMDLQKNEIQASQDAYIFKQMTVQLKEKAEKELMSRYGFVITDLKFLMDENDERPFPGNLQKVVIQLTEQTEERKAVEAVKTIEINANEPLLKEKETSQKEKIVSLLSKQWNMDENTIEVHIDGGD